MAPTTTSDSPAADPGVHGLSYPPGFLQSLPILLSRPAPHAPIRAITAEQFAEIHKLNAFADPDDAVLFPFLHGVEGTNASQNSFFANASMRNSAAFYAHPLFQSTNHTFTIPTYRGLIWVRADEVYEHNVPSGTRTINDYSSDGDDDQLFEDDDDGRDGRDETMHGELHDDAFDGLHSLRHSSSSDSSSDSPLSVSTTPTSLMSPPPSFQCTPIPAPPHAPSQLLLSSLRSDELLSANLDGPCFLPPRVPDGISLRNFGIQVPIYATLSDIVVYSPKGLTRSAFALAERFKHSIEAKARERERLGVNYGPIPYNVFVITDTFDVFEEKFPYLVATDSHGQLMNHIDFNQREREEMCNFTKASEVMDGVWLGNLNDVPLCQNSLLIGDPFIGGETNPFGFDLCIECVDGAHFPSAAELSCVEHHLRKLDEQWVDRWRAIADADASKRGERTPPRPSPNPTHVVHIQFPSSPGLSQHATSNVMSFLSFLHRTLYPAPNGASEELPVSLSSIFTPRRPSLSERSATPPTPKASTTPRKCRILLWSSDGYTETSILALCLLMSPKPAHYVAPHPTASSVLGVSADASHTLQPASPGKIRPVDPRTAGYGGAGYCSKNHGSMTLPEAYLELQITRQRSFFVYQNDLDLLKRMESKLLAAGKESVIRSKERERERDLFTGGVATEGGGESPLSSGSRWKFPTWGTRSGSLSIPNPPVIEEASAMAPSIGPPTIFHSLSTSTPSTTLLGSTSIAPRRRARASTSPMPNVHAEHWAWFNDPRFDGSFPSRVLPFLYLGNLAHASNAYMLHALGITHVVSVGECALVPPSSNQHLCQAASYRFSYGGKVLGAGPGSLWIEEREGRINVLDIKGVSDDGIDSLRPRFREVCNWIDAAREQGGKILIHCRVGVSRSATITIAYAMRHLGLSLVDAYLLVRSRRLSVLIQPNLRLLYNLCSWEVELAREHADEARQKAFLSRRLAWPFLAREVHYLNEKYIQ